MDRHRAPAPTAGTLGAVEESRARAWQSEVRAWAPTVLDPGSGRPSRRSGGHAPRVRCHVGVPAGERVVLPDEAALAALGAGADSPTGPGLRVDLVARALDGLEQLAPVAVWVARAAPLGLGDVELAWHSAARHALARHGLDPDRFVVLSPDGWLHVSSGERRRVVRRGSWVGADRTPRAPRPWDDETG